MESILTSIKLLLGMTEDYDAFDPHIIMHINSVFTILKQLGVGPEKGFRIEDKTVTWNDYITETEDLTFDSVKTYVYAKVRLIFDPPASSAHIQALKELINEFEWRLKTDAEFTNSSE
jgi:hypothetical protein